MKPNDEQLDDLLRDLTVPAGLKQTLLRIPNEQPVVAHPAVLFPAWRIAGWVLAAGIAGVACWFCWPLDKPVGGNPVAVTDNRALSGNDSRAQLEIDQLDQEIEVLNARIRLREAELRLAELWRDQPRSEVSGADQLSLALALSAQSAIELGVGRDAVREDMQKVVQRYPQSAGAEIASQFLAGVESKNPMNP